MTTPTIPFAPRCSISVESLREAAAQRDLAPGLEQRRDGQGQFVSHRDLPDTARRDK